MALNINFIQIAEYILNLLATRPFSPQDSSIQIPSSINQDLLPESNASGTNATSESPQRKNLRPRSSAQRGESTPRSKTKSRKRNVFTEDEADDEDEKERYLFETRPLTRL